MTWPILIGTNSGIENDYTVEAVPTVFIIDGAANMKIKNYHLGSPGYTVIMTEINAIIPEFLPSFFLSLFMIATSLAAVVYKRKPIEKR